MENVKSQKTPWYQRTNEERKESHKQTVVNTIMMAVKNGNDVFSRNSKDSNRDFIAYDATNGNPYGELNTLILDIKKEEMGYKENIWVGENDLRFLKSPMKNKSETGSNIDNLKEEFKKAADEGKAISISYIQRERNKAIQNLETGETIYQKEKLETPIFTNKRVVNIAEMPSVMKHRDLIEELNIVKIKSVNLTDKSPNASSDLLFRDLENTKLYDKVRDNIKDYLLESNAKDNFLQKILIKQVKETATALNNAELNRAEIKDSIAEMSKLAIKEYKKSIGTDKGEQSINAYKMGFIQSHALLMEKKMNEAKEQFSDSVKEIEKVVGKDIIVKENKMGLAAEQKEEKTSSQNKEEKTSQEKETKNAKEKNKESKTNTANTKTATQKPKVKAKKTVKEEHRGNGL